MAPLISSLPTYTENIAQACSGDTAAAGLRNILRTTSTTAADLDLLDTATWGYQLSTLTPANNIAENRTDGAGALEFY